MKRFMPLFALSLAACAPQSAQLSNASLTAWLDLDTSFTLFQGRFDPEDVDDNWSIDCRNLDANDEFLRLDDTLDICHDDLTVEPNFDEWPFGESWLGRRAWRGIHMDLEPWRGEGIFTHEGDLQVGFHQRLPGGEDFRFAFAIDPDFNPTECDDDGQPVPFDGEPWLDQWAQDWQNLNNRPEVQDDSFLAQALEDFPNGRLYLLNARAYQFDIAALDNPNTYVWTIPEEWNAGFARGTFSAEDMHSRPTRFGEPSVYLEADAENFVALPRDDIWYAACPDGEDCPAFQEDRTAARDQARFTRRDFNRATPEGVEPDYIPLSPSNLWRPIDDSIGGLDKWAQMDYSWVVLSEDSDATRGGEVRGAFSILMDPDDSNSRFLLQGNFEVPKVKKERWAGRDLYNEQLEEAGTNLCIQ